MLSRAFSFSFRVGFLPQRISRASMMSAVDGVNSRARSGSSGRVHPCRVFSRSRSGPKDFSQPGGNALNALPVESSMRGMTKCSSWCPAWECRTHKILYWSGCIPAKATASKSFITCISCSGVTVSSGPHEHTPAVNFHSRSMLSIRARVMSGPPRSTTGGFSFLP